MYQLQSRLTEEEREAFPVTAEIDIEAYILCVAAATRKYCVNEDNFKVIKIVRTLLLLMPVIFVVAYVVFLNYHTNAVR